MATIQDIVDKLKVAVASSKAINNAPDILAKLYEKQF